jgi:predicted tellurium resistance membrane protein TerC
MIDAYNFTVPEAEHLHLNKNYAYIALAFAMFIEFLNMREKKIRRKKEATSVEESQK